MTYPVFPTGPLQGLTWPEPGALISPGVPAGLLLLGVQIDPVPSPSSADSLMWWKDLMYFEVPPMLTSALTLRSMSVQTIPGAHPASPINLDYYSVTIHQWPRTPDGTVLGSPREVLEYMRIHINEFIDPGLAEFSPYPDGRPESSPLDSIHWFDNGPIGPLGAVMHIELRLLNNIAVVGNPDDASVVVSLRTPDAFQFSTLTTPADSGHPVSGHRRFGYGVGEGLPVTFFTAGADRLHTQFDCALGKVTFDAGHSVWQSWQRGFSSWVNRTTGSPSAAVVEKPISKRYDYPSVVALYPR